VSPGTDRQICVDILADRAQCGGLAEREFACGTSEICLNGVCRCPVHMTRIGERQCADLLYDAAHCGEDRVACSGTAVCVMGVCRT
jgi:hypothetical protein